MNAPLDRDAVASLRTRADEAARELQRLRCHDPAAARAITAVRLTSHTLEMWWLPTLDAMLDE